MNCHLFFLFPSGKIWSLLCRYSYRVNKSTWIVSSLLTSAFIINSDSPRDIIHLSRACSTRVLCFPFSKLVLCAGWSDCRCQFHPDYLIRNNHYATHDKRNHIDCSPDASTGHPNNLQRSAFFNSPGLWHECLHDNRVCTALMLSMMIDRRST